MGGPKHPCFILPPGSSSHAQHLRDYDKVPVTSGTWLQLGDLVVRLICPWDEELEETGNDHAPPADLNQLYQGPHEAVLVQAEVRAEGARLHTPDMRVGLGGHSAHTASSVEPYQAQAHLLNPGQRPVIRTSMDAQGQGTSRGSSGPLHKPPSRETSGALGAPSGGNVVMRAVDTGTGNEWIRNRAARSLELQRQRNSLDASAGNAPAAPAQTKKLSLDLNGSSSRSASQYTGLGVGGQAQNQAALPRIASGDLEGSSQAATGQTWVAVQTRMGPGFDPLAAKVQQLQQGGAGGPRGIFGAPLRADDIRQQVQRQGSRGNAVAGVAQ